MRGNKRGCASAACEIDLNHESWRLMSIIFVIRRVAGGELIVNPIGLNVAGVKGRVDLEATPTLSRVKLIDEADGWRIWTDSNVPLRVEWTHDIFVQLVKDLIDR
jgi:hypothetical protein